METMVVRSARTLFNPRHFGATLGDPVRADARPDRWGPFDAGPPPGQRPPIRVRLPAGQRRAAEARDELQVALCVPMGGTAGIWGPSALASARLAVAELNQRAGIGGRPCRLLTVNASDDAPDIEATLVDLVESGRVDALVGMHTSAVRQRIVRAVGGHLPYIYTPLYEGGETAPGVYAIGETTASQLRPALHWLGRQRRLRRWLAIGNDYVWPRATHRLARGFIAEAGGELVGEHYLPFGANDFEPLLDRIRQAGVDGLLVSLIGQDAVAFNRAFGRSGLARSVLRLSCALGENELLGIGADNADELYVACGYFATLDTDANQAFKERYLRHYGERAPTLNTFGQSTYEGVHFLASLLGRPGPAAPAAARPDSGPVSYRSARSGEYAGRLGSAMPIYLARAEDNVFRVLAQLR